MRSGAGNRTFRGFLFDADNTLLDFDLAERSALLATVAAPAEPLLGEYRRINDALWKDAEAGLLDLGSLATERFRLLVSRLRLSGDPEEIAARYLARLAEQCQLLPGAVSVLDRLSRRAVLGLLTNGIASVQRSRMARSGIEVFFQGIFISEELGVSKPDPAAFHLAAGRLHLAPHELLCVGDSPSADIRGAHAAGMTSCWFNRRGLPYPEGEPPPDFVVTGLEELLRLAPQLS